MYTKAVKANTIAVPFGDGRSWRGRSGISFDAPVTFLLSNNVRAALDFQPCNRHNIVEIACARSDLSPCKPRLIV